MTKRQTLTQSIDEACEADDLRSNAIILKLAAFVLRITTRFSVLSKL